jgi:predicted PurR-regulated permease PerM
MEANKRQPFNWSNSQVALATVFIVVVGVLFWLLFRFRIAVFILFVSIVISIAITPAVEWLQRRKLPRPAGVIVVYLIILAFVIAFLALVAPLLIEQTADIGETMPAYYQDLRQWLISSPSLLVRRMGVELPRRLPWSPSDTAPQILMPNDIEEDSEQEEAVMAQVAMVFSSVGLFLRGVFSILAVILLAFFWTLEGERVTRTLLLVLPQRHREGFREFLDQSETRVGGYIRGVLLLSLIVGGMALAAYTLIGMPYALSLALIAGVMEAVPIIGPGLGAIPALLIALTLDDSTKFLWVLAATALIQLLENTFFGPRVMDKSVGVNPILTLLSLATFTSLLGIPGALLAVPIAALFQLVLERMVRRSTEMEQEADQGRDPLSALRFSIQELSTDIRKYIRASREDLPEDGDILENQLEEITDELNKLISEKRHLQEEPERNWP